ncbi:tryptophan synthase subunit alpha [Streptomyces sp. NPDC101160]|uniref:tryptophan synthase subunit alpha n=1 Tax=Streptomyces sp. NPDC101160 TaxID=3366118 RepID=UPI00380F0754
MAGVDRLGRALRSAEQDRRSLLVVYLTHAPADCRPVELALAAVEAGADVLELGLPTPSAAPRGEEIRDSFRRAAATTTEEAWDVLGRLREALPDTPLLPLIYPETSDDLGWRPLLDGAASAGADGVVLTRPWHDGGLERVAASGLSAVPVLPATASPAEVTRAEAGAQHLTYRALADRTGGRVDLDSARALAEELGRTATKPFLVGFGISEAEEIEALAPHAAGVVVGSAAIRAVRSAAPGARVRALSTAVRAWKNAAHIRR